jgi:hypothetical protein
MEAGELAIYMFSTCLFATLLLHPASPVRHAIHADLSRHLLMGLAIGAEARSRRGSCHRSTQDGGRAKTGGTPFQPQSAANWLRRSSRFTADINLSLLK